MKKDDKKCIDLVRGKFDHVENTFKKAKKYFEYLENDSFVEINNDYKDYDDFFDYCNKYGLSWDYIEPNTFNNQEKGYFRFQLSWGGPSDEFRIFLDVNNNGLNSWIDIDKIEYWYLDWYDGSSIEIPKNSVSFGVCQSFLERECDLLEKITKAVNYEY